MNPEDFLKMLMGDNTPRGNGAKKPLHQYSKEEIEVVCKTLMEMWKISKLHGAAGLVDVSAICIENIDSKVMFHQVLHIDLYTTITRAQRDDIKGASVHMDKEMALLKKHCKVNSDYWEAQQEMEEEESSDWSGATIVDDMHK